MLINDTLEDEVGKVISKHKLFSKSCRLLIAFSSGVDSVVLAYYLQKNGYDVTLAHCNFLLRGEESDGDEAFAKSFGRQFGIPVLSKHFQTAAFAEEHKVGIQEAARTLRYQWFYEILDSSHYGHFNYLLTAHHADDNVETSLFNLFKGTGITGLKAMLPKDGRLVRPFLTVSKDQILTYAQANQLMWREDSSNAFSTYTRNFIRNELIPQAEKAIPNVAANLRGNIDRFRDVWLIYNEAISKKKKALLQPYKFGHRIPINLLLKSNVLETLVYELFHPFGFTSAQVPEITHLLHAETGRFIENEKYRVIKNRLWLQIHQIQEKNTDVYIIQENDQVVETSAGRLEILVIEQLVHIDTDPLMAYIPLGLVKFPLMLRRWKKGDYFYPLGMRRKKKLSDFFIDQKLSIQEKEEVLILETDGKIAWIAGMRLDDRFKIPDINAPIGYTLRFRLIPDDQRS